MKIKLMALFLLTVALNVSAVDVGEEQKSPCPYAVQSGRSNDELSKVKTEAPKEEAKPKAVSR